ncbi:MAG: hypothetical protein A2583_13800 [Bdellovibrionales bacterium RIFOXYD1_FULL_53_11]|nr:MAG: hypothetical protein A2583_13800 [Bdellovibrionales bacterium RIFOXYD1_FULL_53_11]
MFTNQIIITGNLGAGPEIHKKSDDSKGVVSFTLAENVSRLNEKTKQYEQAHTNWFPVKAFGSLGARVRAGLKKGDRVMVTGRLRTFQYETKDGAKANGFEVLADDVTPSGILPKGEKQNETSGNFENFDKGNGGDF